MKRGELGEEFDAEFFNFLIHCPKDVSTDNELAWLPNNSWYSVCALSAFEDFSRLPMDLIEASSRFKEWFNQSTPELEKLPLDWASLDKTPFKKLLVLRCLRPDRMNNALVG